MSQEERVETLPGIIKSLAQQVAARDAQLKDEQAKFEEEFTSMRNRQDDLRVERDNALRTAEELLLERNRLKEEEGVIRAKWVADVESVKLEGQRELAQEKALLVRLKADFDLERAELTSKIGHLEQAASHHTDTLGQARLEAEDWKSRHTAISDELRHRTEEWATQFSRVATSLEELSAVRRNSDSASSPTVAPSYESSSPNTLSSKKSSPLKDSRQPRTIIPPETNDYNRTSFITVHQARPTRPQNTPLKPVTVSANGENTAPSRQQQRLDQAGNSPSSLPSSQRQAKLQPRGSETSVTGSPVKSSSHSTVPLDRVIITAHYEIKKEEDDDADDPSFSDAPEVPVASGSNITDSRYEDDEKQDGEPAAKRRKKTAWKQSARRVILDDDDEKKQFGDEDDEMRGAEDAQEDFDEMAIGAEDNHKEIYGYRRVNVREINTGPRTPPHRLNAQSVSHSGGSSSKKRKAGPANVTPNSHSVTERKR